MCRLGPDGYGSISSWYQWWSSGGAPGSGFGTLNALASSQTRCHFASICSGSYRLFIVDPYSGTAEPRKKRKSLSRERPGELDAALPRSVPVLAKELPVHRADRSNQAGFAHFLVHARVTRVPTPSPQPTWEPSYFDRGRPW